MIACYVLAYNCTCRFDEMPRVVRAPTTTSDHLNRASGTLGQYFATMHCPVCHQLTVDGVCAECMTDSQKVAVILGIKTLGTENVHCDFAKVCYTYPVILEVCCMLPLIPLYTHVPP